MDYREATAHLTSELKTIYEEGEANAIAKLIMEHITRASITEKSPPKTYILSEIQEEELSHFIPRLLQHEPVQYVLNEAWFCGLKLFVDKNVLIPRPETEELVDWIITNCKFPVGTLKILDIGTGSGCIAIALKKKLRKAEVWACDISEAALTVARQNAKNLGITVNFLNFDFLTADEREQLPAFDLLVSNPPYIPLQDKAGMSPNVVNYEPPGALFVPDSDPLVFYRELAKFGLHHLNKKGSIYVEIHEDSGKNAMTLFQQHGYTAEFKKDMQGKERMVKAVLS